MPGLRSHALTLGLLVFNGEEYLRETLDSLCNQTYTNFQLIISDNASTDNTEEICRAYADRDTRIRYIRQPRNIGAIGNFNFLVSEAKSKYFKWCAADDLLAPTFVERCIEFLENHPDFVLCHSRTVTIDGNGVPLENDIIRSSGAAEAANTLADVPPGPASRFRNVLLGNTAVMDIWGVFRLEALRNAGAFQAYIGYEKVLMANVSLLGRIAELPESLFVYRVHPEQFSSQICASAQRNWVGSASDSKTYPWINYVKDYLNSVARADLRVTERARGYVAVVRYVFQVRKWHLILRSLFFGSNFGAGNAQLLKNHSPSAASPAGHNSRGSRV